MLTDLGSGQVELGQPMFGHQLLRLARGDGGFVRVVAGGQREAMLDFAQDAIGDHGSIS